MKPLGVGGGVTIELELGVEGMAEVDEGKRVGAGEVDKVVKGEVAVVPVAIEVGVRMTEDTEEEDIEVEVSVCVDVEISFSTTSLTTRKHASGIISFNPIYSLRLLDFSSFFCFGSTGSNKVRLTSQRGRLGSRQQTYWL